MSKWWGKVLAARVASKAADYEVVSIACSRVSCCDGRYVQDVLVKKGDPPPPGGLNPSVYDRNSSDTEASTVEELLAQGKGNGLNDPLTFDEMRLFLDEELERVEGGWIAYKVFGVHYSPNPSWVIKEESEIVEPDLDEDTIYDCGPGVNVATMKWLVDSMEVDPTNRHEAVWQVLVPKADNTIVVPIGSSGKFRVRRVQLLRQVGTVGDLALVREAEMLARIERTEGVE